MENRPKIDDFAKSSLESTKFSYIEVFFYRIRPVIVGQPHNRTNGVVDEIQDKIKG